MQVTIANHCGTSFSVVESKKDMAEFRRNGKYSTGSTEEAMTIFKTRPVRITGGPNPEEKRSMPFKDTIRRRLTLEELQGKKYWFPDLNFPRILEDLVAKEAIQLLEPKRPKQVRRIADLKYYH